ncbi:MAG: DNA polymerase III subunit gamma/tau [Pseudanabaenaceae cyanobacterium SKYGB_i_bin29]|nr:DNA polymerase III subunit gamma/tau [Pseudanabaenaceae cyanobacterium SKYG29]MDW8422609.1 DNA polymerase III subunit gamma/tau [Pseudanabaenaceae cyanobacterium SKYGB_i_bin29]
MGYEPLHHKYRPQTFADLVGQEGIARTLTNAILQQRIAPAYLFTGARGTGKTSTARIMAKSLNCLASDRPTPNPCGQCTLCLSISKGTALDVTEIDAASNTGVDNIREIIERAQFAPVQARYKVYVIDECHMLSNAAFNALLKTLEEPPDRVVFILATTDPQRVLPTIISRCQRFDFRRIPLEAMVNHLTQIARAENIRIEPEAIRLIAQLSQGGLRDSESLLDQVSLLDGTVTAGMIWDLVGAISEDNLLTLTAAILQGHSIQLLEITRQILDRGREPLVILQSVAALYRDLLIAKTAPDRLDLVSWTGDNWHKLVELASRITTERILQGQQQLRQGELQLKNTTQPRLWLEIILLGLLDSTPAEITTVAPAAVTPSPEVLKVSGVKPLATQQQPSKTTDSYLPSQDVNKFWEQILNNLPMATRALVSQHGRCTEIRLDKVIIEVKSKQFVQKFFAPKQQQIADACQKILQRPVAVEFIIASSSPSPSPAVLPSPAAVPIAAPEPTETRRNDRSVDELQNIVTIFGGEIVDLP